MPLTRLLLELVVLMTDQGGGIGADGGYEPPEEVVITGADKKDEGLIW